MRIQGLAADIFVAAAQPALVIAIVSENRELESGGMGQNQVRECGVDYRVETQRHALLLGFAWLASYRLGGKLVNP